MKLLNSHLPCLDKPGLFLAIALFAVSVYCCEKDPEPLFDKGVISGNVTIYNPGGNLNGNDVRIIADGPYGRRSTLSDYEGNYTLSGLGNGTYEIEFVKEGYGTYRLRDIQIFKNDTLSLSARLYKKASYKMPQLSTLMYYADFNNMDERSVAIITNIPDDFPEEMQIRVFLSDTREVSFKNYIYTEIPRAYHRENNTQLMIVSADPHYYNEGGPILPQGKTRYMIAYVCSLEDDPYFDEYYGLPIYSTVDEQQHSRVFAINLP